MPNRETAARWIKAVKERFSEAEIAASLERMEQALADGPWLAGEEYSLADVDMAPFVHRIAALGAGAMIEARARVADWYTRIRSREAFRAAMAWKPSPQAE